MSGWIPLTVYFVTAFALIRACKGRSRSWLLLTVPLAAATGALTAAIGQWLLSDLGMAGEPAPWQLWLWVGLSGLAIVIMVAGWPGTDRVRRGRTLFAASFALLSVGLTVNAWIGYSPTVYAAWNQLTDGPLPGETDWATMVAMQGGPVPGHGVLVRVDIDADASGFEHREQLVYLPPAWFASVPPPRLPAIMMIGGQFNDPADWLRAGDAISTLDAFAAAHGGNAPVAVFVDPSGSFTNDTECVNGPRGRAADHLISDVVPQVIAKFGVRATEGGWGVAGFSSGGTCAVDLAVMHPAMFGAFVDIAGDRGPNVGTKAQTIDRLFGGDEAAWADFDPVTVMTRHGDYSGVAGLFVVPEGSPGDSDAATALCDAGTLHRIDCAVVPLPGRHVWPFAGTAFAMSLPWLAGQLGTPNVPVVAMPK